MSRQRALSVASVAAGVKCVAVVHKSQWPNAQARLFEIFLAGRAGARGLLQLLQLQRQKILGKQKVFHTQEQYALDP